MRSVKKQLQFSVFVLFYLLTYQVLPAQQNKITVYPNGPVLHEVNSYNFGVNRNHVEKNRNGTVNYPESVAPSTWESIKTEFNKINPKTGGRKLYRLGHTPTDGSSDGFYPGYDWENPYDSPGDGYPYDAINIGLEEADDMNMDIIMVINYGTGTPAKAAGLVDYLETHYDSDGKPWIDRIAFFEIGNEQTGNWEAGHAQDPYPRDYAIKALTFINAMENAADGELKFGVVASHSYQLSWSTPYPVGHPNNNTNWPLTPNAYHMIDDYVDVLGNKFDYLCFHAYSANPTIMFNVNECGTNTPIGNDLDEMASKIMGVPTFSMENLMESKNMSYGDYTQSVSLRQHLETTLSNAGFNPNQVEFALTEFSVQYLDDYPNQWPLFQGTTEALYLADNMMYSMKNNYASCVNFCFLHVGDVNPIPGAGTPPDYISDNLFFNYKLADVNAGNLLKPNYYVQKMLADHLETHIISDDVMNMDEINVTTCWGNYGYEYDNVGTLSTIDPATGVMSVLLLNRSASDIVVDLDINGGNNTYTAEIISQRGTTWTAQKVGVDYLVDTGFSSVSNYNALNLKARSINIVRLTPANGPGGGDCTALTTCNQYYSAELCSDNINFMSISNSVWQINIIDENNNVVETVCGPYNNGGCTDPSSPIFLGTGSYILNVLNNTYNVLCQETVAIEEDCVNCPGPTTGCDDFDFEICGNDINFTSMGNSVWQINIIDANYNLIETICGPNNNGGCTNASSYTFPAGGSYILNVLDNTYSLLCQETVSTGGDCGECEDLTCSQYDAEICDNDINFTSISNSVWQINIIDANYNVIETICGPNNNGGCTNTSSYTFPAPGFYIINILDNTYSVLCQETLTIGNTNREIQPQEAKSSEEAKELELINNLKISPNPTHDVFVIAGIEFLEKNTVLDIYDLTGRLAHTQTMVANSNPHINISNLQSGIYFVTISTEKGEVVFNEKLIRL